MPDPLATDETLFAAALARPPAERARYLDAACAGDPARRARLASLLHAHDGAGHFLEVPPTALTPAGSGPVLPAIEQAGDVIGRYKLLQPIGEGGCGVVWMAEQQEPVMRRVALKVIKLGMDTKEVIARFEAERQALALMDHPNIARVLDAGATAAGRPFFVMELVRGMPITRFCDEQNLSTAARLALFTSVCHAVQHAHQKGIIHRDLKPSNILVSLHDGRPVPKVIDFGIAKATQGRLTDATLFTAFEQFIGTPAYMSPEQAELSGLDIDTRSDIYSLGVLLYELLTGRPPFDPKSLHSAGLDEIRRIIREVDPPRPSLRLSTLEAVDQHTIARQRATVPGHLSMTLRGDLDWIVMRCLEKDRTRRYDSANALAEDLTRHLADEPVRARPPSAAYRCGKFIRRHRLAVAAGTAVACSLLIGLALTTRAYLREKQASERATAAEQAARAEEAKSRQVARFLKDMLGGVGPAVARGRDTRLLREILEQTRTRLAGELAGQPLVEAELRATLGTVYEALGDHAAAEAMDRSRLELIRRTFGEDHPGVAAAMLSLSSLANIQDRMDEAITLGRDALSRLRRANAATDPDRGSALLEALSAQAAIVRRRGDLAEAEQLAREAVGLARQLPVASRRALPFLLLAIVLTDRGRADEAGVVIDEIVAHARSRRDREPGDAASDLHAAGVSRQLGGHLDAAENLFREALELRRRALGADHPALSESWRALGTLALQRADPAAAEQHYREAVALHRRVHGSDHPELAEALEQLAHAAMERADLAGAETALTESLAIRRRSYGPDHGEIADALTGLGVVAERRGDRQAATTKFSEALAMRRRVFGDSHADVANSLRHLAESELASGELASAERIWREHLAVCRRAFGDGDVKTAAALTELGECLRRRNDHAGAEPLMREALAILRRAVPAPSEPVASALFNLAHALYAQEQFAAAEVPLREAATMQQQLAPNVRGDRAKTLLLLGSTLLGRGDLAGATTILAEGWSESTRQTHRDPEISRGLLTALAVTWAEIAKSNPAQASEAGAWQKRLAEFEQSASQITPPR